MDARDYVLFFMYCMFNWCNLFLMRSFVYDSYRHLEFQGNITFTTLLFKYSAVDSIVRLVRQYTQGSPQPYLAAWKQQKQLVELYWHLCYASSNYKSQTSLFERTVISSPMWPETRGIVLFMGPYIYSPVEQSRRSAILEVGGVRNTDPYSVVILK